MALSDKGDGNYLFVSANQVPLVHIFLKSIKYTGSGSSIRLLLDVRILTVNRGEAVN